MSSFFGRLPGYLVLFGLLVCLQAAFADDLAAARQIGLPRIEQMPNLPQPYVMRDWKKVARDYDALVFDRNAKGRFLPLIWIDKSHIGCDDEGFGLPAAMGH